MDGLLGKVALITGAASGIGAATATLLARCGARLVLADGDPSAGQALASRLREQGAEVSFVEVDVARAEDCRRMVDVAGERWCRLDIAFNNAGISGGANGGLKPVGEFDPDNWRRVIDVNLSGVFYGLRYQIPLMLQSGGGAIVNNASIAGLVSEPMLSAYTAAKHGVIGLTKVVCDEYAAQNIRCNAIAPGVIRTPANARLFGSPERSGRHLAATPAARFGEPDEVAQAVLFLCSAGAAYINAACVPVDGGYLVR